MNFQTLLAGAGRAAALPKIPVGLGGTVLLGGIALAIWFSQKQKLEQDRNLAQDHNGDGGAPGY